MHTRAQASNRMSKANKASHGARVSPHTQAKARVRKTRENPKETPEELKSREPRCQLRTQRQNIESGSLRSLKTRNRMQARTFRDLHYNAPRTLPGTMVGMVTNGTMVGVLMSGTMTGVLLDVTKVGNKRMTLPQAHFRSEVWMSVPPVVRRGSSG